MRLKIKTIEKILFIIVIVLLINFLNHDETRYFDEEQNAWIPIQSDSVFAIRYLLATLFLALAGLICNLSPTNFEWKVL